MLFGNSASYISSGDDMIKVFTKKHVIIAILCLILIVLLTICVSRDRESTQVIKTRGIVTGDLRSEFLKNIGLTVEENDYDYKEVLIPQEFDEVYSQYNKMQKTDGFDLKKYAGKTVDKFTYTVKHYPGYENEKIYVNLLIYKGKVIGGDISSARVDGFMKSLYSSLDADS